MFTITNSEFTPFHFGGIESFRFPVFVSSYGDLDWTANALRMVKSELGPIYGGLLYEVDRVLEADPALAELRMNFLRGLAGDWISFVSGTITTPVSKCPLIRVGDLELTVLEVSGIGLGDGLIYAEAKKLSTGLEVYQALVSRLQNSKRFLLAVKSYEVTLCRREHTPGSAWVFDALGLAWHPVANAFAECRIDGGYLLQSHVAGYVTTLTLSYVNGGNLSLLNWKRQKEFRERVTWLEGLLASRVSPKPM